MAEIKSTLDLIMERTKNLTLTEEEKKDIRTREEKAKIKGWLQRYSDGVLTMGDLKENMEQLRAASREAAPLLKTECLTRLEPEADNQKIFQVMSEILEIDTTPFRRLIDSFHEDMLRDRAGLTREALDTLQARGISGTAVIPNLNLHPAWNARRESAREQFRTKLYLVNP